MLDALLEITFPVFAIVGLGWLLAGWKRLDLDHLTELLLYVALPALALDALITHRPAPLDFVRISAAALAVMGVTGVLAYVLALLFDLPRRGLVLVTTFMNAGNFGLPLALLAWGEAGLAHAVLYYLAAAIAQNTVGIWIAKGGAEGWREVFKLPLPYAAVIGLTLAWSDVTPPAFLAKPIAMLGAAAIPLLLLGLGHNLRQVRATAFGPALLATALRMGGGLAVGAAAAALLDLDGMSRNVVLLSSSMPAAVMNFALARRYDAAPAMVSTAVLFSTLLSLVSIPLVLTFLGPAR